MRGFIDDTNGWDFAANDRTVFDGAVDDHGTHVAGIIGAKGGNGKGVAGVCWSVTLISGKFIGFSGGSALGATFGAGIGAVIGVFMAIDNKCIETNQLYNISYVPCW